MPAEGGSWRACAFEVTYEQCCISIVTLTQPVSMRRIRVICGYRIRHRNTGIPVGHPLESVTRSGKEGGGGKGRIHTKQDPRLVEVRAKRRVRKESLEFIRGGSS